MNIELGKGKVLIGNNLTETGFSITFEDNIENLPMGVTYPAKEVKAGKLLGSINITTAESAAVLYEVAGRVLGMLSDKEANGLLLELGEGEIDCSDRHFIIALWPNGDWCDADDLNEISKHAELHTDDYSVVQVLTCSSSAEPITTRPYEGEL